DLAIVGKCQVERDRKGDIKSNTRIADDFSDQASMRDLAHPEERDDGRADDVEGGKAQGLESAADQPKRAAAGEKIAVDRHFAGKEQDENANLEPAQRRFGIECGPLEAVLVLKGVSPVLHGLKIAPAGVEKVLALARLDTKLGGSLHCRTFDDGESALE